MTVQVQIALISVFATLAGTIIGSVTTYIANKNLKKQEWERTLMREDLNERKKLYSDFLAECHRQVLVTADKEDALSMDDLKFIYRYVSSIELLSGKSIAIEAKAIVSHLLTAGAKQKNDESFARIKKRFVREAKSELKGLKHARLSGASGARIHTRS